MKTDPKTGRQYYVDNVGRVHYIMPGMLVESAKDLLSSLSTYVGLGWDLLKSGGGAGTALNLGYIHMDNVWDNWMKQYVKNNGEYLGPGGKSLKNNRNKK